MSEAYRSIFLERDWLHVRFQGWADAWPEEGIRAMTKAAGPLRRTLLLSETPCPGRLGRAVEAAVGAGGPAAELVVHDLTGDAAIEPSLLARGFQIAGPGERLLNVATFAIHLGRSDEALLQAMSKTNRWGVRRCLAAGYRVEEALSDSAEREAFHICRRRVAEDKSLRPLDGRLVRRMMDSGEARLFWIGKDARPQAFCLTYRAGNKAIYHTGASVGRLEEGVGPLLQWETAKALRNAGCTWYDLGGVPSTRPEDGIFAYKRKLGGCFVDLGREYIWRTPVAGLMRQGLALAMTARRAWRG